MDIQAYIESGVLELYAAGSLSLIEERAVESMLSKEPVLLAELEAIQAAIETYANVYAVAPSESLKARIMSSLPEKTQVESAAVSSQSAVGASPLYVASAKSNNRRWLMAASWVGLALSVLLNGYFYSQWKISDDKVVALKADRSELVSNLLMQEASYRTKDSQLKVVANPATKIVTLAGVPTLPDAKVTVYWNSLSQLTYLTIQNLPPPPPGKQYQLWALADGKPIDAGVLARNTPLTELQTMKLIGQAQAFAITLENDGGSPTPTLTQMIVVGKIS